MSELAIPSNYLEACQAWQEVIDMQSTTGDKLAAGDQALDGMANYTFFDRKVIVSGETALFIPDGTSQEERVYPYMQFGEVTTRGWLGRLNAVRMHQEVFLTWAIYDPSIIGPAQDEMIEPTTVEDGELYQLPLDEPLRRAMHFPVGLINYALPYKNG